MTGLCRTTGWRFRWTAMPCRWPERAERTSSWWVATKTWSTPAAFPFVGVVPPEEFVGGAVADDPFGEPSPVPRPVEPGAGAGGAMTVLSPVLSED